MEPTCKVGRSVSALDLVKVKVLKREEDRMLLLVEISMAIWGTYHLIDCFDNCKHLVVADLAITVDIVELECPVEFVLHFAATSDR